MSLSTWLPLLLMLFWFLHKAFFRNTKGVPGTLCSTIEEPLRQHTYQGQVIPTEEHVY